MSNELDPHGLSLKILNLFDYGDTDVTSSDVKKTYNVSLQDASNKLRIMYKQGWLKRRRDQNARYGYKYRLCKRGLKVLGWMDKNNIYHPCKHTDQHIDELKYKNNIRS